ncbi:hypothetical protein ABZ078_32875 [Streptomyces sp. NPDC006385]|uniref:hypothetical protein n=1 Tax=Streptomyces sp. NPDC006385 TaxID=3156761 RepID=UPI0033AE6194
MRLATIAAGLATVGAFAASSPASAAANGDVTVTLRVTISHGDSVIAKINGVDTCFVGFTPGKPKDIVVSGPSGSWAHLGSTLDCYSFTGHFGGNTLTTNGAVIPVTF